MSSSNLYDISVQTINGEKQQISAYKGKVLLVVNVASKCGFTNQYEGLEKVYRQYKDKGVEVLGFPCNQFGSQEPGSEEDIKKFCQLTYDVSFPMFAKVDVNGDQAHPLFQHLKKQAPGILGTENIKWNFTKFLIDKEGNVVKRYAPQDKPEAIAKDLESLL